MGQARVDKEGIARRQQMVDAYESQIRIWKMMSEKSPVLDKLRDATNLAMGVVKRDVEEMNKTLSFATEADRLVLAKLNGKLEGLESVYYDIADAPKKIAGAEQVIAKLLEEIRRAKKGELLDTRA